MQLEMLGVEGGKKGVRAKKKKVVAGTPWNLPEISKKRAHFIVETRCMEQ
jgi:hypothetical protein